MSLLLKHILCNGQVCDIRITQNKFTQIMPHLNALPHEEIFEDKGKAILPAFYNMHTHASMTLLKGLGDDKELFSWLSEDIWPREAKFDNTTVYIGTKLAILEMIKSGTVFFSDMYFEQEAIIRAVDELGIRASVGFVGFDMFEDGQTQQKMKDVQKFLELDNPCPDRIQKALDIHAVYTVSEKLIKHFVSLAQEHHLPLHIHACETKKEVEDCQKAHGCSPIVYLDKLGALSPKTCLAHAIWLDDNDIRIIRDKGVTLITNPMSNYKLASGVFPFEKLQQAGCKLTLGTDGSSSNNSLSMLEEMKLCALSAKIQSNSPMAGKAEDVFKIATRNGADFFDIDAGEIKEGKVADAIIVDLDTPQMVPCHNLISNMVYAADSSVIDSVLCDGKFVMKNQIIPQEKQILTEAHSVLKKLG